MNVLQMSLIASVLIVAIIIMRAIVLYRLPKKVFLCLWGIVVVRLLVPFSIPRPIGYSTVDISAISATGVYAMLNEAINDGTRGAIAIPIVQVLWLAGVCICGMYFAVLYIVCSKEFKASLPIENEIINCWLKEHPLRRRIQIRQTDRAKAPLTYGIIRPVILLPNRIDLTNEKSLRYILTHEYTHIRHFDALTKLILTATVCFHWFNPLVWIMYILANRDIELICDETVIRASGINMKSAYARILIEQEEIKGHTAIISHFSKSSIEERIIAIMKTKKRTISALIVTLVLIVSTVAVFTIGSVHYASVVLPDGPSPGPLNEDETAGVLVSVNANDESRYTAEEWANILKKVEAGEILFFETLEDERAYHSLN